MKPKLLFLALLSTLAFGHQGVELGPNGGRILEFSKDETMHGELTVKANKFHITLRDKDMKSVPVGQQKLTATTGDRAAPQKLIVESDATGFTLPVVQPGEWLILQFKETADSKAVTARFEYNTAICEGCQVQEWVCKCKLEEEKK